MQHKLITALMLVSIVSAYAEPVQDSWSSWRQTAETKAEDGGKVIEKQVLYKLNPAESESPAEISGKLQVLREDGKTFFRISPDSQRTVFSYRPEKAEGAKEGFQLSFLFRVGDVSTPLISGEGALADIHLHNGGKSFHFALQAAYVNNGTWFLNGLNLRQDGKVVKLAKQSANSAAVLRQGPPIDRDWHKLTIQSTPSHMRIMLDEVEVFNAEDPALEFNRMVMVFSVPTPKLKWTDFSEIEVKRIEAAVK